MTHLIYDTETTGKWLYDLPATHESQPRMVQIGAILADDNARVLAEINLIVKPEGFIIPDDAAAVHGITQEIALKFGVPLIIAMGAFSNLLRMADVQVAFNIEYDVDICRREARMLGKEKDFPIDGPRKHCVMKQMAPICRIPKPSGYRRNPNDPWKWPKLDEAFQHVFGEPFKGTAHNAMEDVRATGRLYFAMFWKDRETGAQLMPGVATTTPAPAVTETKPPGMLL